MSADHIEAPLALRERSRRRASAADRVHTAPSPDAAQFNTDAMNWSQRPAYTSLELFLVYERRNVITPLAARVTDSVIAAIAQCGSATLERPIGGEVTGRKAFALVESLTMLPAPVPAYFKVMDLCDHRHRPTRGPTTRMISSSRSRASGSTTRSGTATRRRGPTPWHRTRRHSRTTPIAPPMRRKSTLACPSAS